ILVVAMDNSPVGVGKVEESIIRAEAHSITKNSVTWKYSMILAGCNANDGSDIRFQMSIHRADPDDALAIAPAIIEPFVSGKRPGTVHWRGGAGGEVQPDQRRA
ncbi:MAG TPA: hypothetical protein PKD55_20510, partial [Bellilinea sp.]|nr:hypothetical protein [Bellilinea sp.]